VALEAHDWPGNVRELANAIEHACAFCESQTIRPEHLPETVRLAPVSARSPGADNVLTLEAAERLAIILALRATGGHRARAAQLLQIERHRLYRNISRYRLENLADSLAV
jgi:DNA-binding NtrC family response regulator